MSPRRKSPRLLPVGPSSHECHKKETKIELILLLKFDCSTDFELIKIVS